MYRQRRDISSVAATLPTGKIFLPQVKYAPDNLAVSEICVNTHTFARRITTGISRASIYTFSATSAREETSFLSKPSAFLCPYLPICQDNPIKLM